MEIPELKNLASDIRARIIENSHKTQTPHLGSCLSCVDILVAAYFHALRIDPKRPADPDRDRFILSKGHGAAALFQVLALRGFYPADMLKSYGEDGGIFRRTSTDTFALAGHRGGNRLAGTRHADGVGHGAVSADPAPELQRYRAAVRRRMQ